MDARDLAATLSGWQTSDAPLFEALADALERRILDGTLPAGLRLPAERRFAGALDVSRGTVVRAYDALRERDRVHTRHGSGTVVGECRVRPLGTREARVVDRLPLDGIFRGLLGLSEDAIDLRGAFWVGTEDLPDEAFDAAARDLDELRDHHGYWPAGLPSLRAGVARYLRAQGLPTEPEQVLITTGGQQAIALAATMTLGQGDEVLVEELTYPGAVDAFATSEARMVALPVSPVDGVDHVALAREIRQRRPRLAYLVPSHHNPTGAVVPHAVRRLIAEAVAGTSTLLIDDLALADTWFERPPPPPILSYLPEAEPNVLTIGSLAKSLWGGLRIGFVRADEALLTRLVRLKTVADIGSPVDAQVTAAHLLARLDEIAAPRRAEVLRRYDALTDALARHLPSWTWVEPQGGLCLWVHLDGVSSVRLAQRAARYGVGVTPGLASSVTGEHDGWLRLPFGQRPEILVEAVDRLARAWDDLRTRPREATAVIV